MTEIVGTVDATEVVASGVFAMPTYVVVENGSITTAKLADGAVTSAKLDPSLRVTIDRSFETVAEMQAATDLEAGMTCHTNGFHSAGDGGAAFYTVGASGTENGMDVLELQGGLLATLATNRDNPACYGADTSGVRDSTAQINACIAASSVVKFAVGTYRVDGTVTINKETDIDFNGASVVNNTAVSVLFDISFSNDITSSMRFENGNIDTKATTAISVTTAYNVTINSIDMICSGNGIVIADSSTPSDALISNLLMTNRDMSLDYVGLSLGRSDNKVVDCKINGFKTAVDHHSKQQYFENVHFLAVNIGNVSTIDGNYIANNNCASTPFVGCYCDSYGVFLKGTTYTGTITNLCIHNYSNKIGTAALIQVEQDIKLIMDGYYDNTSYHNNEIIMLSENERFLATVKTCKVKMVYTARFESWTNCLTKEIPYQNIWNGYTEPNTWSELGTFVWTHKDSYIKAALIFEGVLVGLNFDLNNNVIAKTSAVLPDFRFGYTVDANNQHLLHFYMTSVNGGVWYKPNCYVISSYMLYAPYNSNGYIANSPRTTTAPDYVTAS